MSLPLIIACVWVLLAAGVAMLPMRRQYVPGVALLVAAPVLLVWIGVTHGWLVVTLATLGFLSMFRNPLIWMFRRATGRPAPLPEDTP